MASKKIIVVSEKHQKTLAPQSKNVVWNVLELAKEKTIDTNWTTHNHS
jgi:hypothetical protein